jgi:hypothetical protein
MYSANRFPVMLYEGGPVGYAEGGLHDEAMAVRKAGRNGDSRLVHVNDEEYAEMVAEYGEPTINPETGMPEFFLGKLGKILKAVAPIALNFIPGVGPLASAAVGAALGATGGGGLKGALLGGALGGLGAGGAGGVGAKLGTSVLGTSVTPRLAQALGSAALGAGASAALGGNPLTGALGVGLGNYLRNPMAKVTPGAPTPTTVSTPEVTVTPTAAPATGGVRFDTSSVGLRPDQYSSFDRALEAGLNNGMKTPGFNSFDFSKVGLSPEQMASLKPVLETGLTNAANAPMLVDSSLKISPDVQASLNKTVAGAAAPTATAKPNFWNKDFLGLGVVKNKYAVPAILGAAAVSDALKPKDKTDEMTQEQFFGPSFNAKSPGNFRLASLSGSPAAESIMSDYGKRYFNGFAYGGDVDSFAVKGPGTGRSDEIPAMLSDGEYVIDAETVALLGDGSSKAGAKKLDDLRVKIRKHKGKKLAKGKFSHDAKPADKYMAGGRI